MPRGISLVLGPGPLHIFGVIFTVVASGDAIVLWLLRDVPADARVQDHPDRVGASWRGTARHRPLINPTNRKLPGCMHGSSES